MPRFQDDQMEHRADQPLWQLSFKFAEGNFSADYNLIDTNEINM